MLTKAKIKQWLDYYETKKVYDSGKCRQNETIIFLNGQLNFLRIVREQLLKKNSFDINKDQKDFLKEYGGD